MPFSSKAQQRFMYSQHPKLAAEFSKDMSAKDFEKLPEKKNEAYKRAADKRS